MSKLRKRVRVTDKFFMLILFIFLSELAAAILAFLFREHMTREYFTRELKRHYQGHNTSDVFTSTWNAIMSSFECCGVSGPQDFDDSLFRLLSPRSDAPGQGPGVTRQAPGVKAHSPGSEVETRGALADSVLEQCVSGAVAYYTNYKGCYSSLVDYFETYIYSAGALAIIVLSIEDDCSVLALVWSNLTLQVSGSEVQFAVPGQSLSLPCPYTFEDQAPLSELSVQWKSPQNQLLCHFVKHKTFLNCSSGYSLSYSPANVSLVITSVQERDYGTHLCSVSKRHEFTDSQVQVSRHTVPRGTCICPHVHTLRAHTALFTRDIELSARPDALDTRASLQTQGLQSKMKCPL
ncbi:hypothetical protein WMY93_012879 [Mugilogobius chulae]|uniref:Ig-like domain-containing protein n=1 Tax=Mugilogobius chulae TaxID=88201 RepID=A0AAW0P001_9GOBI